MTDRHMIVVDTLNIFSCASLFLRFRKDKKIFYLFKAEGKGIDFLIRTMKRQHWEFAEMDDELGSTPEGSDFIELQKEYQRLAEKETRPKIRKKMEKCALFSEREKEIIGSYLNSLIETVLYQGLEILKYVERIPRGDRLTVLLQSTPLKSVFKKECAKKGISLRFYKTYFGFRLHRRKEYYEMLQIFSVKYNRFFIRKLAGLLGRIAADIIFCAYHSLFRQKSSGMNHHFDICAIVPSYERSRWFHDLNWRLGSRSGMWRVLGVIYSIPDEQFSLYRGFADHWIDLRGLKIEKGASSIYEWMLPGLFSVSIRNLWRIFRSIFVFGFSWHLLIYLSELFWEEGKFEALFRRFRVKLLWTNIEWIHLQSTAAALAIHRLGGVSLGSTWSVYAYPVMTAQRNTNDIFFAWGKRHAAIFQDANAACQNFVISGYIGDFYLSNFQKEAQKLRNEWNDEFGSKFVICYYDNIFLKNIYVTPSHVLRFFSHLLFWVKDHSEILLVFKSKKRDAFEQYPMETTKILREMEREKRLMYRSELADLAPGFASDLIVGLYVATLPSLLAAYGKEVILFDHHRLYKEWPVHDLKNVTFIEQAEEIKEALNSAMEKQKTVPKKGDLLNPSPGALDPFCDGKAISRINDYFSDLLADLKKRGGSDAAMLAANEKYRAKWGSDKVLLNRNCS